MKRFVDMFAGSIKVKLLVLFLLFALLPLAVVEYISYSSGRNALLDLFVDSLTNIAQTREAAINLYLSGKEGRALDFCSDQFINDAIERIGQGGPEMDRHILEFSEYLRKYKKPLDPEIYETFVLDVTGKIIASTRSESVGGNKADDDYFIGGLRGAHVKDVYSSKTTGQTGFAVSAPIESRVTGKTAACPPERGVCALRGNGGNFTRCAGDGCSESGP